jgi:hypothetical protein
LMPSALASSLRAMAQPLLLLSTSTVVVHVRGVKLHGDGNI